MAENAVSEERLRDLRRVLRKLDPKGRKDWALELYELRDGEERISAVIDIRTGKPWKARRQEAAPDNILGE